MDADAAPKQINPRYFRLCAVYGSDGQLERRALVRQITRRLSRCLADEVLSKPNITSVVKTGFIARLLYGSLSRRRPLHLNVFSSHPYMICGKVTPPSADIGPSIIGVSSPNSGAINNPK